MARCRRCQSKHARRPGTGGSHPTAELRGGGRGGGPARPERARERGNLRPASPRSGSCEEVDAVGFGPLTSQPLERQAVHGASAYRDGTWRVVMSRALTDDDPNDVEIATARPS